MLATRSRSCRRAGTSSIRPSARCENRAVDEPAPAEAALVERARRGDIAAYESIVEQFQDVAGRTAYALLGDHGEAQDAVQEAFVKAYYALDRFRVGSPFRPWLLRIVANEAINRARKTRRQVLIGLTPDDERGGEGPTPEESALELEQRTELLSAVNSLRADDRLVIAYRFWLDLSEAEMAAALGCARGTVKSRLSRAVDRLRKHLGVERGGVARDRAPSLAAPADVPTLPVTGAPDLARVEISEEDGDG
jgi:RNA polymerase sigma factor (sigma-70 family)